MSINCLFIGTYIFSNTTCSDVFAPLPADRLKAFRGKNVNPNGNEFIIKSIGLSGRIVQEVNITEQLKIDNVFFPTK